MSQRRAHRTGDRIGSYELVSTLGSGAMGQVWEAVLHGPVGFEKPVALKLLRAALTTDPDATSALVHEARMGARLHHPNVVGTYALGEANGTWFVAMELVRGPSVHELLAAGPLAPALVLDIGGQVAAGLAHIHELQLGDRPAGLVHRDIKPSNLLVDGTGIVKIGDLGISSLQGDPSSPAGTPGYMAPEQAKGHAEQASDLFSLGATLYVLATGRRPFGRGVEAIASLGRIDHVVRSPRFVAPVEQALPGLGAVVQRCLRGEPRQRYASAREVLGDLRSLRFDPPSGATLLQLVGPSEPTPLGPSPSDPTVVLPVGNVPPRRDRFFGRRDELDSLVQLLDAGERLIVLLGPGGMGKTRLAMEAARQLRTRFDGGAWAFDLTEARSEDGVSSAVAAALAVPLDRTDPVGQLGRLLAGKGRALVVLDNLEQCVQHLPATLGRWRELAPEIHFVCTSRIALRLRGEQPVQLGPLGPDTAVGLFLDRAPVDVPPEHQDDVRVLVEAVEGMPLCVELAAARLRLMAVPELRRRLGLALLSGGGRDLPERHRSVAASLEWSWDLLSEDARSALAQLSVCDGGFTLEAAEAILTTQGWALDLLQELTEASLVRVDQATARFSCLVVVRTFASGKLDEDARAGAERRHGAHFALLGAPEALANLRRPGATRRWATLCLETENLVAACRRATTRGDEDVAVATLRAAWTVLRTQGPVKTALELCEELLDRDPSPRGTGFAHGVAGAACRLLGSGGDARTHLDAALVIETQRGSPHDRAVVLDSQGVLLGSRGQLTEGLEKMNEALALHRQLGNRTAEATTQGNVALALYELGRHEDAHAAFEAALAAAREVGDRRTEARILGNRGTFALKAGRLDEAEGLLTTSLEVHQELGDRATMGDFLCNLGMVHWARKNLDEAERLFLAALEAHREVGSSRALITVYTNLGDVARDRGQHGESAAAHERALAVAEGLGDRRTTSYRLAKVAEARLQQAAMGPALEALARAESLARLEQDPLLLGFCLGRLALLDARAGRTSGVRARLDEADALLATTDEIDERIRIQLTRAEVAWQAGDDSGARSALSAARALGPPDDTEVADELRAVIGLLAAP